MAAQKSVIAIVLAAALLGGCGAVDSEVSRSDVERNKREFSQEAYEDAMKKAGKGDELAAEKKRNEEHMAGQGGQ